MTVEPYLLLTLERLPMKVQDKVCIVTGAASGIGKEIALTYAREGSKVVIADLNKDAAQAVADEIAQAGGAAMAALCAHLWWKNRFPSRRLPLVSVKMT